MKINTILFLLFTFVISTEIRDETTLGSVVNEANIKIETIPNKFEKFLYEKYDKGWFDRETSLLAAYLLIFFLIIAADCIIYTKHEENINRKVEFLVNRKWIGFPIRIIHGIVVIVLISIVILLILMMLLTPIIYLFYLPIAYVSFIDSLFE